MGSPGRKAVAELLPRLRTAHGINVVIANGENSAGGSGITPATAAEIFAAGVDVSGNLDALRVGGLVVAGLVLLFTSGWTMFVIVGLVLVAFEVAVTALAARKPTEPLAQT